MELAVRVAIVLGDVACLPTAVEDDLRGAASLDERQVPIDQHPVLDGEHDWSVTPTRATKAGTTTRQSAPTPSSVRLGVATNGMLVEGFTW